MKVSLRDLLVKKPEANGFAVPISDGEKRLFNVAMFNAVLVLSFLLLPIILGLQAVDIFVSSSLVSLKTVLLLVAIFPWGSFVLWKIKAVEKFCYNVAYVLVLDNERTQKCRKAAKGVM